MKESVPRSGHPWNERREPWARAAFVLALLVVAVFGLVNAAIGPSPLADDYAQYLLHAQALAEGRPYVDTGYIYSALQWGAGPPLQSPGYPVTVAAFYALIGERAWIPVAVNLLGGLLFAGLAGLYFRRHHGPWSGVWVTAVVGLMVVQADAMATPGPDLVFCALAWAVVLVVDAPGKIGWGRTIAVLGLTWAAIAYRAAALPLVPALVAFGLLRGTSREGWRMIGTGALAGVAFWWLLSVVGIASNPPMPDYLAEAIDAIPESAVEVEDAVTRIELLRVRAPVLARGVFETQLYPFGLKRLDQAYHVVASVLMFVGVLLWGLGRWRSFGVLFAGAYVSMIILLPFGIARYLWPLAPVVAYGIFQGARTLGRVLPAGARRAMPVAAVGVLVLTLFAVVREPQPRPISDRADIQAVFAGLSEAERAGDVRAAFYKARTLALETGVQASALFGADIDEVVLLEVDSLALTHIVVGSLNDEMRDVVRQWERIVGEHPDRFLPVLDEGAFRVYEVVR